MARIMIPETWLSDLILSAEQQAPGDMGKQAVIMGRAAGDLIEQIYGEDPMRGIDLLLALERAVRVGG